MEKPRRKKRKKKNYLLRLVIIVAAVVCAALLMHINYFDIKGIAVVGNNEISDKEILKLSELETDKSIFDVHPLIVQHKIKQNLYVESVNVDRKLPREVIIKIKERSCRAQFKKGKKYVVTDNKGMVIDIAEKKRKATLVKDITVTGVQKKKKIKIKEEEKFAKAMEFITVTEEGDIYFKELKLDGNRIEARVYSKLKCIGKYNDVVKSIKSGTLKSVIYDLYQKGSEKGTINVYSNDYCFFTPQK